MDYLNNFLGPLNPNKGDHTILFYGLEYNLWRGGRFIGKATWTQDKNVGDSFQSRTPGENGKVNVVIFTADKWELIDNIEVSVVEEFNKRI